MTSTDLRLRYKTETGDPHFPADLVFLENEDYVFWLEEQLIKFF
jgi:hypothetical protein